MAGGRARHPPSRRVFHLIGLLLASLLPATSRAQPPPETVTVGLIIDADSPVGRIANTTIPMALDDFYAAFPNASTRVRVLQHDSRGDVVAAASAALQLMTAQGARAILGPQSSVESAFVADLATRAEVPVVSFSATSPSVSHSEARFFARAALSDGAQAEAIAALATYFGWRRVVPIYQDDDYGAAFVPFLVDALTAARAEVPYRCALPEGATRDAVAAAMYRLESQQTRAFVVHARPALAELVFAAAVDAGMMAEGYAWVITDGLTGLLGSIHPPQGVIGLAPHVPPTARLRDVRRRWAHRFMRQHPDADPAQAEMGCYALWAYDAAWAVASAAERLSPGDLSSPPGLVGGRSGPTDFSGLGKSMSGEKFLAAITNTTFEGLGGRFDLKDGELAVPAFRIVNIMDNAKERGIGFWTQKDGLHRHLGRRRGVASNSGLDRRAIWLGPADERPEAAGGGAGGRRPWLPADLAPRRRPNNEADGSRRVRDRGVRGGGASAAIRAAVRVRASGLHALQHSSRESRKWGVRRGGGGHHHHGGAVAARGLHAAVHVVGDLHGGADARPAKEARLGLPQAAPLRPLARQLRLLHLHRLRRLGRRAPQQRRVPWPPVLPDRHPPLLRLLDPRLCTQGEPEEQPVAVRGGGVGVRGAHPAVQLHGEPDVHADGAAARAGDRGLRRTVVGNGQGRGHEQLLHVGGHDQQVGLPSVQARAVPGHAELPRGPAQRHHRRHRRRDPLPQALPQLLLRQLHQDRPEQQDRRLRLRVPQGLAVRGGPVAGDPEPDRERRDEQDRAQVVRRR